MNTIITIGRQYATGGKEIADKVAAHYGIKCYDKELISHVASNSGFCEEMIEQHDERPTNSFLYNIVMDTYSFGYNASNFVDMPLSQKVFLAQFDTIRSIADEGPCVFVGRCADNALADRGNVLNLFIHADEDSRVKALVEHQPDLTEDKARDLIIKKDKQRQSYYNYYSSKKWGRADTYDFTINSAVLGIDGTVDLIIQLVDDFERIKGIQ